MDILEKLAFYRAQPNFQNVFISLLCGLEPNVLIAQLKDERWYELKFVPFRGKWAVLVKETPRPPDHELGLLEWLNDKHTLN